MADNQQQQQFLAGMSVYDSDDHKVGKVTRYDETLGYFETEGTFSGTRYIPFSAIEPIGPTGTKGVFVVPDAPGGEVFVWTDSTLFRTTAACGPARN